MLNIMTLSQKQLVAAFGRKNIGNSVGITCLPRAFNKPPTTTRNTPQPKFPRFTAHVGYSPLPPRHSPSLYRLHVERYLHIAIPGLAIQIEITLLSKSD